MEVFHELYSRIRVLPVVDTHEHYHSLQPFKQDLIGLLTSCASMYLDCMFPEEAAKIKDTSVLEEERYLIFCGLWEKLRFTGAGRQTQKMIEMMGVREILPGTYPQLRAAAAKATQQSPQLKNIKATIANTLGHSSFGGVRGIRAYLNGENQPDPTVFMLLCVTGLHVVKNLYALNEIADAAEMRLEQLEDWERAVEKLITSCVEKGVVGFKELFAYERTMRFQRVNRHKAEEEWNVFVATGRYAPCLADYMLGYVYAICEKLKKPMAVHIGCTIWSCMTAPKVLDFMDILQTFPKMPFELYHLNYPVMDDYFVVLKSAHHTYASGAWINGVDPEYMREFLKKALYCLPANRVIAFGADCGQQNIQVAAHLDMAYENIAWVLEEEVKCRRISMDEAENIAWQWLYASPKALYKIIV